MILKESGMHKSQKNHRKMEEPGVVVEGFGDTDETYSDLQDESVTLVVEMLFYLVLSSGGRGPGGVQIAMQFIHASCLNLFLQFQRPV
jgi:hypothetical protein